MIALIKKLYANDVIRYIFFGGCTTVVNLASFFLQYCYGSIDSNAISLCLSLSLITDTVLPVTVHSMPNNLKSVAVTPSTVTRFVMHRIYANLYKKTLIRYT